MLMGISSRRALCGVRLERNGHSGRGGGGLRTWEGKYGRKLGQGTAVTVGVCWAKVWILFCVFFQVRCEQ